MKHIEKKMIQTSSVRMWDFFNLFRVSGYTDEHNLCWKKSWSLIYASSTECQKPRSNINCILRILLSQKCYWRFSQVFCVQKTTKITETKNRTGRRFWKAAFLVAPISIRLLQKLIFKRSVPEEHTSSSLHFPFRFGVNIDRNQLILLILLQNAENGVKERVSVLLNLKNIYNKIYSFKKLISFSDFYRHDLSFLVKILIFLKFVGKNNF